MLKSTDLHSTDHAHAMAFGTTKTASASTASVSLTILGVLPSMKNRRRLLKNRRTAKMFSAKSVEAMGYVGCFSAQVPRSAQLRLGSKENPLRAIVSVWYPSWRSDLDCGLVYDLLQITGVVSNDRWIREKFEYAHVDPDNPRVELVIEEI